MLNRYAQLHRIQKLDPERDWQEIAQLRRLDFRLDVMVALELALFRTYGIPTISALLDSTGEFAQRGQKRFDDTALLLYHILGGPDSPSGREAIRQLNRIHSVYDISNDDYIYTLAAFVVTPKRWIDRYGWRKMSDQEIRASVALHRRVGQLMGIRNLPTSFAEFSQFLDDYERSHFRYTETNHRVALATLQIFEERVPKSVRPFIRPIVRALLDEPLLAALGLAPAPRPLRIAIDKALGLRARILRHCPPSSKSRANRPPAVLSYPGGYEIADLGPAHARRCPMNLE